MPSGHDVECSSADTVLAALEKSGYTLPNNCRAGACGECKVRVLDGEFDQGMVLDMALSAQERADGLGLMCMAKPTSDVLEIEFGTDRALPKLFPPREGMPFIVTDLLPRTPVVVEVHLRPLGDNLRFWPGQYVMIGDEAAGAPPRPYSLANAPRPDGELKLLVSRVPGGATSGWIHHRLAVGDQIELSGPYGTFVGDPSQTTPVLCLASGSGLAPILSLTDAALRRGYPNDVTLLFSARKQVDLFDQGLMRWWERRHRRFRFLVTYTGEAPADAVYRGRIPAVVAEMYPSLADHSVFVAGNPAFVAGCRDAVLALGADPARLHLESYFPQAIAEIPPDDRLS